MEKLRCADKEVFKGQAHSHKDGFIILLKGGTFLVPVRGQHNHGGTPGCDREWRSVTLGTYGKGQARQRRKLRGDRAEAGVGGGSSEVCLRTPLVWLRGLGVVLQSKGSFPVRAHVRVVG